MYVDCKKADQSGKNLSCHLEDLESVLSAFLCSTKYKVFHKKVRAVGLGDQHELSSGDQHELSSFERCHGIECPQWSWVMTNSSKTNYVSLMWWDDDRHKDCFLTFYGTSCIYLWPFEKRKKSHFSNLQVPYKYIL